MNSAGFGTASQDPTLLWGKAATIQVGTLLIPTGGITGLDVWFKVHRGVKVTAGSTKPQPNTCDLKLYNLSPDHRKQLEASTVPGAGTKVVPVVISAGYLGRQSVIFSGELRAAHSVPDGEGTIVTELNTGDGDKALAQQRLTLSLARGSSATTALSALVKALGVGEGNLATQLFSYGGVLKGSASELMTSFCRSVGMDWSIQNGNLQLTALGQPMGGKAILIDADHGLLGSPTVDTKGILSLQTLMIPDLLPGVALSMNSTNIQGGYRVIGVETTGSTFGDEWGHEVEAARY
jgi:hypothetical protein